MSQSNYRAKRSSIPPVFIAPVQMFLTTPNGTIAGAVFTATASWNQILSALRTGTQITPLGSENPTTGTGAFGPVTGNSYDPTIFDFSIAAVIVTTPANVALVELAMGGFELGVGVDAGQASSAVFAQAATLSQTGRVMTLSTPQAPGQMPLSGDIVIGTKTTAILGANQTVFATFLLWVQKRGDLA